MVALSNLLALCQDYLLLAYQEGYLDKDLGHKGKGSMHVTGVLAVRRKVLWIIVEAAEGIACACMLHVCENELLHILEVCTQPMLTNKTT
jgi:hypothetical protein